MSHIGKKRLTKELSDLQNGGCPEGCTMIKADDLQEWVIGMVGPPSTIYEGESFALRFRFGTSYPIESPEVVFLVTPSRGAHTLEGTYLGTFQAPEHPHIYSNGHICASILSSGWSPVLSTKSICLTLQSMLSSCKQKERPPDNERYIKTAPISPKDTRWVFHDDTV